MFEVWVRWVGVCWDVYEKVFLILYGLYMFTMFWLDIDDNGA